MLRSDILLKSTCSKVILVVIAALSSLTVEVVWAGPPAQNLTGVTLTGVATTDSAGEITIIIPSETVVTGCTNANYYMVRDANSVNAFLAIATSALIAGRTVDMYVTGACDPTNGQPLISQIVLH
jgi:hypothetical protein